MSTSTIADVSREAGGPAQRLRRVAAAVRLCLHWWGVQRTLSNQQKEEVGAAYAADIRFLTAGKKIVAVRHEAFREAVRLAEQAFLGEFAKLVAHLTERLGGSDGERRVFRDSAVTNLLEFFEKFKRLNVRSSAELDQLVEQAQELVRGVTPQELRDNGGLRDRIAARLSLVQNDRDALLVERPRRQIMRLNSSRNGGQHATPDWYGPDRRHGFGRGGLFRWPALAAVSSGLCGFVVTLTAQTWGRVRHFLTAASIRG